MMGKTCKNLFKEIWWLTDNIDAMKEFVELVKEFVDWNRGNIALELFDLSEYDGFDVGEMFIAYNDMGGCMNTTVYDASDFVELMTDTYNQYEDVEYLENFWIPRLKRLIKENDC